ncbi:MAG: hypothetical protein IPI95_15020 [Flavobacteriales bacterium]|nr:hypothetical protein [Flavobacteriales bacterium]
MRTPAAILLALIASSLRAGSPPEKNDRAGMVSIGGRSSISLFNGTDSNSPVPVPAGSCASALRTA